MNLSNAKGMIKKHSFELTCGGAAVLALAVCYFGVPFVWGGFPAVTQELSEEAHKRMGEKKSITSVLKETPNLEGVNIGARVEKDDAVLITFTDSLGKLRELANDQMKETKVKALQKAAIGNRSRRVQVAYEGTDKELVSALFWDEDLEYRLKIPAGQRLLKSKKFLPATNTFRFVDIYKDAFTKLTLMLNGSADNVTEGVVPDFATLEKAYMEERRRTEEADPFRRPTAGGAAAAAPPLNLAERDDYVKKGVMSVANRTQMYVDPRTAFFIRPMGGGNAPPTPNEIWEGYVDIWLYRDVVEAIVKTNKDGNRTGQGVAKSLIPQLLSISVGPSAKGLFPATSSSSPMGTAAGTGAPVAGPAPAGPEIKGPSGIFERIPPQGEKEKLDNGQSVTGRVGDDQYYVVMMSVSVVCEPTAVNKFINNLYERNNGYTIVNRRDSAVDPYTSASNGFLYGNRQCIRVDLLVECLMFRSWVDQVLPDPYPQ